MTITCENITHIYRQGKQEDVTALRNCQLHLPEHSVTVLLGISGSGKSTLLRLIGLQEYPTSGRILFDSVDVTRLSESERSRMRARDIGFIHQNYRLIPMLTVEENIRYGRLDATDEEVINIRKRYVNETATQIWQDYKDKYTLGSFKQILIGVKFSHLPIYKKQQRSWINIDYTNENSN